MDSNLFDVGLFSSDLESALEHDSVIANALRLNLSLREYSTQVDRDLELAEVGFCSAVRWCDMILISWEEARLCAREKRDVTRAPARGWPRALVETCACAAAASCRLADVY